MGVKEAYIYPAGIEESNAKALGGTLLTSPRHSEHAIKQGHRLLPFYSQ